MSGKLSKAFKWGASALRVAKVRFVAESVRVGDDTLFGPNVQVYDREHEFNREGSPRSCFMHRLPSGGAAGFVPTWSSRVAVRLRIVRSSQPTPLLLVTFSKRARCVLWRVCTVD